MSIKIYNQIVESIYDSSLNPTNWHDTVTMLKEAFNSNCAGFFIQTENHKLGDFFFVGVDPEELRIYGEHFAEVNPWFTVPGLMKPGHVLTDRSLEILHKDKKAFTKTEMYNDWCHPLEFRHAMGGNLQNRNGNLLNFSFFRPEGSGYYSSEEINFYSSLCRHLMKAVEVSSRLEDMKLTQSLSEYALDQLCIGIILLDKFQKISYINRYAKKILSSGDTLKIESSRISSTNRGNRDRINHIIQNAFQANKAGSTSLSRPCGSPLSLSVIVANEQREFIGQRSVQASVFVIDPDDREIGNSEYLAGRWGLTPLEAEFCTHLLRNNSISEIGEILNLTKNTSRWYIKQIMQKLDVKRQPELIIKIMNDLATFGITGAVN